MATSRVTIKTLALSVLPLVLCSLTLLIYLWSKYESIEDCAAIVYYHPISIKDIIIMSLICMFWYGVSLLLFKKANKAFLITEGAIYVLLLLVFSIGGNSILENRKIDWPTEYQPQPIEKEIKQPSINHFSDWPRVKPQCKPQGNKPSRRAS